MARYEDLRNQALAGQRGPGLTVLLRGGMKAWLDGWSGCAPVTPLVRPAADPPGALVPAEVQMELAHVLASMALNAWQEARA